MAPVLGYWDVRGLGNPIRYLLTHANVDYEEKLYKCGGPPEFDRTMWLNDKFNLGLDFPNLPYYIDGDVKLTQSQAILRHLARKHGLDGKTEAEKARVDMAVSQLTDNHMDFVRLVYNPEFAQLKDAYVNGDPAKGFRVSMADKLKLLTSFLGDRKFVAGDYVTYADFVFFEYLEGQSFFKSDLLKDYPVLEEYHKRIRAVEGVDKYFKSPNAITFPFNGAPAYFGGAYSDQLSK